MKCKIKTNGKTAFILSSRLCLDKIVYAGRKEYGVWHAKYLMPKSNVSQLQDGNFSGDGMLAKIRTQGTSQIAYEELKKAIISGKLTSGVPLVERDLAAQLGVSRTPVHEAINRLEAEHLVHRLPNKRVVVAEISATDLQQLYTIRASLEVLAAKWAIPRITPGVITAMENNLDRMEHYGKTFDHERISQLNVAFHRIILDTSKSWYLSMYMDKIHDATRLFRAQSTYLPGRIEAIIKDHREIVQAFESKDEESAIRCITKHVEDAWHALVDQYNPADASASSSVGA